MGSLHDLKPKQHFLPCKPEKQIDLIIPVSIISQFGQNRMKTTCCSKAEVNQITNNSLIKLNL